MGNGECWASESPLCQMGGGEGMGRQFSSSVIEFVVMFVMVAFGSDGELSIG